MLAGGGKPESFAAVERVMGNRSVVSGLADLTKAKMPAIKPPGGDFLYPIEGKDIAGYWQPLDIYFETRARAGQLVEILAEAREASTLGALLDPDHPLLKQIPLPPAHKRLMESARTAVAGEPKESILGRRMDYLRDFTAFTLGENLVFGLRYRAALSG